MPVIDNVERMQGAERDVILFGFTCSDPGLIFSEFLNNPNRFNVVLTRARLKVIVVGSKLFFRFVALKIFSTIAVKMTVILNIPALSGINRIIRNDFQAWQA